MMWEATLEFDPQHDITPDDYTGIVRRILVLSGGGFRGVFTARFLEKMEEAFPALEKQGVTREAFDALKAKLREYEVGS